VNPESERVYVANLQSFSVSVVDGTAGTAVATLSVGDAPQAVAVNPDSDFVYVANGESASVSVIDGASATVVDTVPVGAGPLSVAVDPKADRVYVVNAAESTVSVVEGAAARVVATIPVDGMPWAVAVNPQTNRIYVAQRLNNTVLVIDGGRIRQASPAAAISVDVDIDDNDDGTADNTATSLGTIDPCISVRKGATFDVDIVMTDAADLKVWNVTFRYEPSVVNVTDRDVQMLLAANAASQVKDHSYGDPGLGGAYDLLTSDVSDEAGAHESGSGVLARLTLRAVASGTSRVTVEDPLLFPFQPVESTASAVIAVDEACPD
jgi:YVTN family beta-propeller protein